MDEPLRSRDELEAENAKLRAVLEYVLAQNEERIRELAEKQALIQEELAAYEDAAHRAVADLHAMIQRMWAWEHRQRQRYGRQRHTAAAVEAKQAERLAAYMEANGGVLPERAGHGTVQEAAKQCGCSQSQIHYAVKKAKKLT